MPNKKIRGKKRKLSSMIDRIISLTEVFPEEEPIYWHMHLPAAQNFIDSPKTPQFIRRRCIQTLIDRTEHLISIRPQNIKFTRVVTIIDLPFLWNSQIVVFFNEEYYNNFFIRDTSEQTWTLLSDKRDLLKEWNLNKPSGLQIRGYNEKLFDDGYTHVGEIWIIGEH